MEWGHVERMRISRSSSTLHLILFIRDVAYVVKHKKHLVGPGRIIPMLRISTVATSSYGLKPCTRHERAWWVLISMEAWCFCCGSCSVLECTIFDTIGRQRCNTLFCRYFWDSTLTSCHNKIEHYLNTVETKNANWSGRSNTLSHFTCTQLPG